MIKYQTKKGDSVTVESVDHFDVDVEAYSNIVRSRAELTELRDAIDQALNTSAEEIEDAAN